MPEWVPHSVDALVRWAPVRIVFLIVVAIIVRAVAHKLIDRAVQRAVRRPRTRLGAVEQLARATGVEGDRRAQRLAALGSLARSVVTVLLVFVTAVMVLAELGFNIASIIAGTSIAGLTVAFGLQNVVKDFVAGVFMLIEDQLGVGDYVDMKVAAGTVEGIGLRITQLRDDDGTMWYVRNGEMVRVGNYSQGGPGRPPANDDPANDDPGHDDPDDGPTRQTRPGPNLRIRPRR